MQASSVLISVIMPAYNCVNYIRQAIDSVLSQKETSFELLIADDCSADATKEIIDSYVDPRIKTFHNSTNQGYLKASNLLMQKAKGKYIVFQDADDYATPERFKMLSSCLEINTDVCAVGSNAVTVDEKGNELSVSNFPLTHEAILHKFSNYSIPIVGSALMFRREILSTIGFYHTYFDRIGWEDFYWFSQIIQKCKVQNLPEAMYYYRTNPHSVSLQNKSYRSVVGFDVCVYYMKERAAGRLDHIALGNYGKVDEMMLRFYISHMAKERVTLSPLEIFRMAPDFFSGFRLNFFKMRHKF